jgi:hypothetical protein
VFTNFRVIATLLAFAQAGTLLLLFVSCSVSNGSSVDRIKKECSSWAMPMRRRQGCGEREMVVEYRGDYVELSE